MPPKSTRSRRPDLAGLKRRQYDPSVRVIPLRCLGSLNIVWIADALSRGIDGVIMVGCKYGDDYQCHFTKGSELAQRRSFSGWRISRRCTPFTLFISC